MKGSRKSQKQLSIHKKVKYYSEDDEDERLRRVDAKKTQIYAEFEKFKKEEKLNAPEISKVVEVRLKTQLEELLVENARKQDALDRLINTDAILEEENGEAFNFTQTVSRFDTTGFSNRNHGNETYLSVGFQPNRTTTTLLGVAEGNPARTAEALGMKRGELQETLANIELLLEQEEELETVVVEKFKELKENQVVFQKKMNELKYMNNHADKRFADLMRLEVLAKNKQASMAGDLNELKENIREVQDQEEVYKKKKEDEKDQAQAYIHKREKELTDVLIEIDNKKQEFERSKEELRRIEILNENMRDKRKTTLTISKYIETFEALEQGKSELDSPTVGGSSSRRALKSVSSFTGHVIKLAHNSRRGSKRNSMLVTGSPGSGAHTPKSQEGSPVRNNSTMDRNQYIEKIQDFYRKHENGAEKLADTLGSHYAEQTGKEKSLKLTYEELQTQKRDKEMELGKLFAQLLLTKVKNRYIDNGLTGSRIIQGNEHDAIDSGMLTINNHQTTLNNALFDYQHAKDADNLPVLFSNTEAFVMRCYLDSMEMITRLSKVLNSINTHSNGHLPDDLRDLTLHIQSFLKSLRRGKKHSRGTELSLSHTNSAITETVDHLRIPTANTNSSDSYRGKDPMEIPVGLNLREIHDIFLNYFIGEVKKADEFVLKIKGDVMVSSFVTMDDVRAFFEDRTNGGPEDITKESTISIEDLRNISIKNMVERLDGFFQIYSDFTALVSRLTTESCTYLENKGQKAELIEDLNERTVENTEYVKKALQKKMQVMNERYEYDPDRDFRKDEDWVKMRKESSHREHRVKHHQALTEAEERRENEEWENEDLRAKINEIAKANSMRTKMEQKISHFKGFGRSRNEEDQKRLQAKKDKEMQKQIMENMNDEDFLNYQRKQIKGAREDKVVEVNEMPSLRKAQADQVSRLSQTVPLEELKRMIENHKTISKIQIIERQKTVTDGKRGVKNTIENYVPSDPKKFPRSLLHSSGGQDWRIKIQRNGFTPSNRHITTSDGLSFQDNSFRIGSTNTLNVSRFKQQAQEEFKTEPTTAESRRHHHLAVIQPKRIGAFSSTKYTDETETSIEPKEPKKSRMPALQNLLGSPKEAKRKNKGGDNTVTSGSHLLDTVKSMKSVQSVRNLRFGERTNTEGSQPSSSNKLNAHSGLLPKLDKLDKEQKIIKKKNDGQGKKKKRKGVNNAKDMLQAQESYNLNLLLNLQTNPMLNMVHSPFFSPEVGLASSTLIDDYKFDSYNFKAPALLFSEKM